MSQRKGGLRSERESGEKEMERGVKLEQMEQEEQVPDPVEHVEER